MNKENIIKTIKYENLSTEELTELNWLLNQDQYKERPVTIDEFCDSDDFIHKKWNNIFPLWRQTLREIFPTPFNAPYNEILISAAAGCVDKETEVLTEKGWIKINQYNNENIAVYCENGSIKYEQPIEYIHGETDIWYHFKNQDIDMKLSPEHTICFYENNKLSYISAQELSTLDKEIELPTPDGKVKLNGKKDVLIIPAGPFDLKYCFRTSTSMWIMRRNGKVVITCNSGKTVTATISVLYDLYKLGCLKDPCKFYNLANDTMIIMAIFSATAGTATVNWNDITTGIESCPWINEKVIDRRGLEKKYGSIEPVEILKGLYIQTGSRFQHSMGKAIFDGLMDEAAFGGTNLKESQKTYNELSSRMKTRFSTYSETGNIPGHLFLISSPKEAGDFMQHRIEESKKADAKFTKIMMNISSWDSNPNNDSDDKFTVFIGNENKEPCIYDPDEEVPLEEMDDLIYPPMRYYEEFKKDLLISIMNYGGITTTSDMALFKSPILLNSVFVLDNPFYKDVVELPFATSDKTLMDFCDLSYFKDIRHPEYNRFIHIDAAYSTNTLDVYGLAAGYCVEKDVVEFSNEAIQNPEDDIFSKKDREYFVDFAVGVTAPHGQEVNLTKVQDFIEYLIRNCNYPVACITADQFQSKQTLQNLQNKGFNTDYVSVDRSRDPYLFLRYLIHNRQILLAKNEYLKYELKKLRDDGKRVDHPVSCARGDMVVKLLNGQDKTIKELADMGPQHRFWVYSCTPDGTIVPALAYNAHKTKIATDLIEITLDNEEKVVFTPDHLFMLRNGDYKQAKDLQIGDSLMPIRYSKYKKYEILWDNKTNKQVATHKLVYRHFNGEYDGKTHVIHHCNVTPSDNTPSNLKLMKKEDHTQLHFVLMDMGRKKQEELRKDPNYQISLNEKQKQFWNSEKGKKVRQKANKKWKKTWSKKDPNEISQKIKAGFTPEVLEKVKQRGRELNATYWKSDIGRKRRQELSKTQLRDASKIAYQNAAQNRLEVFNKYKDKLDFTQSLSYTHMASKVKQTEVSSPTLAKAIQENVKIDFKQLILQAFKKHNLTREQAKDYFKCTGYCLRHNLRKYNLEYLIENDNFNHKVKAIKWLRNVNEDVYDITVPKYHNFALAAGVFVHNCHKDVADAVAGAIWKCANSTDIINKGHVVSAVLNKDDFLMEFSPNAIVRNEQSMSLEMDDFERLKEQFSNGIFKGL